MLFRVVELFVGILCLRWSRSKAAADVGQEFETLVTKVLYALKDARGQSALNSEQRLPAPLCVPRPHESSISRRVRDLQSADDIGVAVMTDGQFVETRVRYINETWGPRFRHLLFSSAGNRSRARGLRMFYPVAPPEFLRLWSAQSYMSHLYKGHMGLDRLYRRFPNLPWYVLTGDDTFIFDVFTVDALSLVSGNPATEAVCAGSLARFSFSRLRLILDWMSDKCSRVAADDEKIQCLRRVEPLLLPYANLTWVYGAAVFCTNAALTLLQPFLSTTLVKGYVAEYGNLFRDFVPVSDMILGRCMRDLDIRLVDIPALGYWGGDRLPGAVDEIQAWEEEEEYRGSLPEAPRIGERPSVWHKLTEPSQFRAVAFWTDIIRALARQHAARW